MTYQVWPPVHVHRLGVVQLDVQVLVHALQAQLEFVESHLVGCCWCGGVHKVVPHDEGKSTEHLAALVGLAKATSLRFELLTFMGANPPP